MKISKTIVSGLASVAVFSSIGLAQDAIDYIKTFGMHLYGSNGFAELKLTPAEFEAFVSGLRSAYEGKKLPENMQEYGPKMMEYLNARVEANMAEKAKESAAKAAEYWKGLEKKEGLKKTASGLAYEITEEGSGKMPNENSDVVVKYTGSLIDGTVFDSTDKHGGQPATFNLAQVIPGFREGLQKIAKGGKARLYIPSKLGYQNQSVPGIPPNSTLIFDVEMVDVDPHADTPSAEVKKTEGEKK